jgi:hypothetical protein
MQDRPDAHELVAAIAMFLSDEVRPEVPGELRFQVLVAANACAILARELASDGDPVVEEAARLRALVGDDLDARLVETESGRRHLADGGEFRALQQEVARAIRAGDLDDRFGEAVDVLRESVRAKLAVAHPGYDGLADDGRD